jgi:hypothetical protein
MIFVIDQSVSRAPAKDMLRSGERLWNVEGFLEPCSQREWLTHLTALLPSSSQAPNPCELVPGLGWRRMSL